MATTRNTPFDRPSHAVRGSELAEYFRQIREIPLLTPEEEIELMGRLRRTGCEQARERVVCGNLRLAVYIAKRYAHLGVPLQDLVEAANVGLLMAVDRFDPARGARFATYAQWWIRRSIFRALAEQGRMIHLPQDAQKARRICRDAIERVSVTLGRAATPEEVSRETGLPLSAVVRAPALQPHSLSAPPAAEGQGPVEVADPRAEPVGQNVARDEVRQKVRDSLPRLPERERRVVARHFGLDGDEPATTRQIARDLRTTEQQVRRVLECALGRLRMLLAPGESDETLLMAG